MHLGIDGTYQSVINNPGGGATFLIEIIPPLKDYLTASGDSLTVFCPPSDRHYYERLGISTKVFPTYPGTVRGLSMHVLIPLASIILGVDVLLQPGNFASLIKTTKQIVIAQSLLTFKLFPEELGPIKTLYRRLMVWLTTKRSDTIIFLSQAQQLQFMTYYRHMHQHMVIYPGAPYIARTSINQKKWILVVSSLWEYKNLKGIIDIAAGLKERNLDIPIKIVGDGPQFDSLQKLLRKTGLFHTVELMGAKPLSQVYSLYTDAVLTINLSRAESFGFPVLESMTFGVPVLISDQSAMKEVAGNAAIVVSGRDDALDWIETLVKDDVAWNKMSSLGLARAASYSWETTARKIASLCKSI